MSLSIYTLKSLGFEEISNEKKFEATFSLAKAYQVEGISLQESESASLMDWCHKSKDFSFAFGNSLNEIYQYLLDEDFDEDEEKWMVDNNARPPFLIIIVHLNKYFICESGYWKKEKIQDREFILTYESFSEAKKLLKIKEEKIIPQIISSLSVCFSSLHKPVRFRSIQTETYGKTTLEESIYDFQMVISCRMSAAPYINPADLKALIHTSINLHSQLDSKVSFFLYSALQEKDRLKQFLFFFLSIEIYTNQIFKTLKKSDFKKYRNKEKDIPDRIKVSGKEFIFDKKSEDKRGELFNHFLWCTILAWERIDDNDIGGFILLKQFRNDIAHGENISEAMLPIDMIERLCLKILSSQQTS
jgi:hypothetical protein